MSWSNADRAGLLPLIITDADNRPVAEQVNERYAHGGGWNPMQGFKLTWDVVDNGLESLRLLYPGDPPLKEVSRYLCNDELVVLFEADFVAIIQIDLTYEVSRMD